MDLSLPPIVRRYFFFTAALSLPLSTLAPPTARALPGDEAPPSFRPGVFDRVEEFRLDNGMLFLLLPRRDTPTVSGHLMVRAGNVDNPVGQTGLAHMFEHMAFKGTDRIGTTDWSAEKEIQDSVSTMTSALARETGRRERGDGQRVEELQGELDRLLERQSEYIVPVEFPRLYDGYTVNFNAWTSPDFTTYWTELPANNLEVWMLMESERLQNPVFREFPQERQVVMEERRQHTEESPVRAAWELAYSLAFTAHPYRFPTIGYMSDLETLTLEQADRFFETYYVPASCVAALVGNFDSGQAKQMILDYFGDIPAGPPPPEITTVEPSPRGMRRAELRQGSQRRVFLCFPGFGPSDPKRIVAGLLSSVLGRDETSRLNRRLDVEEHAAGRINVSSTGGYLRYPGVFEIEVETLEGFTNERVEELVWEELERVVSAPVSEEKLDEIRRSYRNSYLRSLETNSGLAEELAGHQQIHGDWRVTYRRFEDYARVTPEDVTDLARELFRRDLATVVYLEPEEAEDEGNGGES
jgi:predicted Zn-dependent peptidase